MNKKDVNRIINVSFAALFFTSYVTVANIMDLRQSCNKVTEQVIVLEQEVQELKEETITILETYEPVDEQPEPEPEPEPTPTPVKKNPINWNYDYVLRVVAAECRDQSFKGQMAVAQVIQERAKASGMTPEAVVKEKNQFAAPTSMSNVTDSVREACERVFINGEKVTYKPIKYFYSTRNGFVSKMHESKTYVMTIDDHKFFMD